MRYEADAGRLLFTEEVFEQQVRVPAGSWLPAPNAWVDARGDPAIHRDELECPEGWAWRDAWTVSTGKRTALSRWFNIISINMLNLNFG